MSEYQVRGGCCTRLRSPLRSQAALMRRSLLVGSLRGPAGPPGRPAPAKAGPAARPPRGRGPGSGGGLWPPLPALMLPGLSALRKEVCGALLPLPPSPFGSGVCGRFLAAPGAAAPLRRCLAGLAPFGPGPPAPAVAGSGPADGALVAVAPRRRRAAPFPPGSLARPVCAVAGSVGARCRPCALASPRSAVGFLWSPLLCSGAPLRFGSARRVPPWSPPSGLRARGLLARGLGGVAAVPLLRPRALFCARALRSLRFSLFRKLSVFGGFSPGAPRPPPPAGGLRERVACGLGAAAPAASLLPGVGLFPSSRAPSHSSGSGKGQAGRFPPLPSPQRFFWRKALTMANICATMSVGCLSRCFGIHPKGCPWGGERSPASAGLLFLPVLSSTFAKSFGGVLPPFP